MPKIKYVQENPNKTVAVFRIDADLLGDLSKVVIERSGKLKTYSPMAQTMMPDNHQCQTSTSGSSVGGASNATLTVEGARADNATSQQPSLSQEEALDILKGALVRIDLTAEKTHTDVAFAKKSDWTRDEVVAIGTFLSRMNMADYLHVNAVVSNIKAHPRFSPGQNPVKGFVAKQFEVTINPALAKDGGAMELLDIQIKPDGGIEADVVLVGACNGCSHFGDQTLKNAVAALNEALDTQVKPRAPQNKNLQSLRFETINRKKIPDLVIVR